jgi:ankyrin repeat protein
MGLLTELIQRNSWGALEHTLAEGQRSRQDRLISELFVSDRLGRTPLHYACAKKQAPEPVVSLMLDRCGTHWSNSRDICGNTPLHAAAANGNASVVRVLMENLCSQRLQYVNDVGSTPLLMAWKKYLDPAFTLFGHVNAVGRMSPKVSENIHLLTSVQDVVQLQEDADYSCLQDVWNKTACLVARAKGSSVLVRPLHDIVTVGGKRHVQCPTVAYWLAIRLYAHQLHLTDEHGNLPIHLAAQHPDLHVIPMIMDHDELSVLEATESALTQLAKQHPKGAVTPNRDDRLPIHLAIESGKAYEHGIHALVHAAPQTLEQRDVKTKLPPFLLAAASPKAPLTVVWELVRARPDLVLNMATNKREEARKRRAASDANGESCAKKFKTCEPHCLSR